MIDVSNIYKTYGDLEVLKGISMSISEGELVAIVGKSGVGKSTLLQIIGSLDKPDKGKVLIDSQDIFSFSKKQLANFRNQELGFVFQFHHLLDEFTALENAILPALIAKKNKKKAEQKALELFDYLGIKERSEHRPKELSGGEQQRVAIIRALINDPTILLADEPTGNLDHDASMEINRLFLNLSNDLKQTTLIVTHDLNLADACHRQLRMVDGQFVD